MSQPKLFFIGTGNMGLPMAANLLRAGYELHVHDMDRSKAQSLLDAGAHWADTLAQGVAQADVIIASLPGPPQVQAVMLSDDGVFAHLRAGQVVIDTSTSSVPLARELDAKAQARGAHYLESPITNAVDGAASGRLSIFIAGQREVYEASLPIYKTLGTKLFFVGAAGNAATVKLLTNLLWFVSAATIGEALMLGAKAGVDLNTVWEAIKASAGDSWVVQHDVPSIFAGHYDPSFSLALCCKDLQLVNEIAREQGYELTMGRFAQQVFEQARQTYGADAAELHVARLLEDRVGLLLRPPHGVSTSADPS
jgi:3-hydroxyisobutyrate dehydrogenase-like beta-hydroxyacid dehydrogenase